MTPFKGEILKHVRMKLIVGFAGLFLSLLFLHYLNLHERINIFVLFIILLAFAILFRIFVSPDITALYNRVSVLEKIALEHNKGAQMLVRRDLELTRANEKLHELDQVKSNFISVAAHQLRTPLSGIKWTLSMLISGELGTLNNHQKTFLMKTNESNSRMIALVNDLLGADRIQSGKIRYQFTRLNIRDLVDNVLFEIAAQAERRQISISLNVEKDLPNAYVDPETMRGVFQNLLENAIKYTMRDGKVDIEITKENNHLKVAIKDNGIGIPKDQQKNIFNRFFRATNAVKQETDGSGLGLFIAKNIVEQNGGAIWFESEEGKGTSFYFTIPAADEGEHKSINKQK